MRSAAKGNSRWSYQQGNTLLTLGTDAARLRGVVIQDRKDGEVVTVDQTVNPPDGGLFMALPRITQ
jgi:hypothetical protein